VNYKKCFNLEGEIPIPHGVKPRPFFNANPLSHFTKMDQFDGGIAYFDNGCLKKSKFRDKGSTEVIKKFDKKTFTSFFFISSCKILVHLKSKLEIVNHVTKETLASFDGIFEHVRSNINLDAVIISPNFDLDPKFLFCFENEINENCPATSLHPISVDETHLYILPTYNNTKFYFQIDRQFSVDYLAFDSEILLASWLSSDVILTQFAYSGFNRACFFVCTINKIDFEMKTFKVDAANGRNSHFPLFTQVPRVYELIDFYKSKMLLRDENDLALEVLNIKNGKLSIF
jgi:hypothetical protein